MHGTMVYMHTGQPVSDIALLHVEILGAHGGG